jgi:hypothetical protein
MDEVFFQKWHFAPYCTVSYLYVQKGDSFYFPAQADGFFYLMVRHSESVFTALARGALGCYSNVVYSRYYRQETVGLVPGTYLVAEIFDKIFF